MVAIVDRFHCTILAIHLELAFKMNMGCFCCLVPRPPPIFVLQFVFSIIHGSGRVA